ncbi:MAG: phosphate/phosphite/phosphonate ABC transporter substrate-binding protein [Deltaproteobacteria bacterium]|nr:phosphate/phosphite/phosphonate ABC transporter substrate-binding protein [Deltaproteobacteria bacterium]
MQRIKHLVVFATIALYFLSNRNANPAEPAPEEINAKSLALGVVSEINRNAIENHFGDFVRYTALKLSPASNIKGSVIVAPTTFELVKLLEQRKVDFFMDSPYATYIVNQVHGAARLLLRRWKRGKAEYQSLLFTKTNSGIRNLEDLQGKMIAFEDPDSTSGYYLPNLFLQRKGFKLANKTRYDPHNSPTNIGYIFAYSQAKLVNLVLTNEVAAGAFSDDDLAKLDAATRSQVIILAQTERLPRHLVSVREDLSPALAGRLEKILLSMHQNDDGRRILKKTDDTTMFDMLPGGEAGMRRRLLQTFYSIESKEKTP